MPYSTVKISSEPGMLIKDRKGPPIHIIPACDIQNIALNGVLPNMHIIFVDTGVPLSRRQANGVYAKIGVHLVKGWVLLEAVGNTTFYADVGNFLKQKHRADLDTAMKELTMCANTRIPIFSCCMPCPNNIVGNN
jgi:hypothetical protein